MQNNMSDQGGEPIGAGGCSEAMMAQHSIYQLGSFVIAVGFLVPPNVGLAQALWLRSTLVIGGFCHVLWAAPVLCWPDALGWNMACLFLNMLHLAYLIYLVYPITFEDEIEKVYETHFKPFNITKKEFKKVLECDGEIYELDATGRYALENKTRTDRQIAMLLAGRMVVSAGGQFLHYVHPTQFLDSPEWEASHSGQKSKFQVTITADTDCRYIQWRRRKLDNFLRREPFLRSVFETTIGKDITKKLYGIDDPMEQPTATRTDKNPTSENEVGNSSGVDTSLDAADADSQGLLSHKWERVISEDDDSSTHGQQQTLGGPGTGIGGGGGPLQGRLSIPASHDGTSSDVSVKSARSIVDIRASIASGRGAADVGSRRSRVGSSPDSQSGGDGSWWPFF
ncbi:popeye domain-containing protein 3-like [Diadema antillarum]|uniref:popeye domain-containing protein 3-like n=1 Tax=Diadema antillarum TaxID=105358 RepID=UPI003A8A4BF2